MKIAIPIFNRATFGRCKTVIDRLSQDPEMEVVVIYPASLELEKYGNVDVYLKEVHGKTTYHRLDYGNVLADHSGACQISGEIIKTISEYIESQEEAPDAVIITADRYEMLPAALAFAHYRIPIYHLQAGEVTGALDEKFRHAITMLSDYQIACTNLATDYIGQMGQAGNRVIFSGCPAVEYVQKSGINRVICEEKPYIILIFHPDTMQALEEADKQAAIVLDAMIQVCETQRLECLVYMPNPDPGRERIYERFQNALLVRPNIFKETKNAEPLVFIQKLAGATAIVGNSSCGLREAAWLGVPAVNIGDRQGPRERPWNVVDVPVDVQKIIKQTIRQIKFKSYKRSRLYNNEGYASDNIYAFIKKEKPTLKGAIGYPYWIEYRYRHFEVGRMHGNQRNISRAKPKRDPFRKPDTGSAEKTGEHQGSEATPQEHLPVQP